MNYLKRTRPKLIGFLLFFPIFFLISISHAEELTLPVSTEILPQTSQQKFRAQVKTEATKYSSGVSDEKLNQSLMMGVQFRWQRANPESTDAVVDFMAEHYVDWNQSQYSVKEIYGSRNFSELLMSGDRASGSIGRKVEFWSKADEQWSLGLWQPLQVFDGLRPEEQGLTGLFWKHQSGNFELLAYSSPIFIPTMEPEVKNENGTLSSNSRWFRSPSQRFQINNRERSIVYSVNTPDIASLIAQPGGGARVLYNKDQLGFWGAIGAAYKPMNKLLLKYDKRLITDGVNQDTGNARLFPEVGYHNLLSVDAGYRWENISLAASVLADRPKDIKPESDSLFIVQRASPSQVYSWTVNAQVSNLNRTNLFLSYLRVDGGDLEDYDAQGNYQGAIFSNRYQYSHAATVGGDIETSLLGKKLITKIKYLREFDQRASLWSGEMNVFLEQNLSAYAGFDILGGDRREADQSATGFLNEFKANDRAFAGVNYVF
jgi:hypothetical protein